MLGEKAKLGFVRAEVKVRWMVFCACVGGSMQCSLLQQGRGEAELILVKNILLR